MVSRKATRALRDELRRRGVADADRVADRAVNHGAFELEAGPGGTAPTDIPDQVFELTELRSIHLVNTAVRTLPAQIAQLRNLTDLTVIENPGFRLPWEAGFLPQLQFLEIRQCANVSIAAGLGNLTRLRSLVLAGCALDEFPEWILQLDGLVELRAWSNRFTQLPEGWGNLRRLTHLSLRDNRLAGLPASMGELSSLVDLNLIGNYLTDLPAELSGLSRLRLARLGRNHFEELPSVVATWTSLDGLDVSTDESRTLTLNEDSVISSTYSYSTPDYRDRPYAGLAALPRSLAGMANLRLINLRKNPRLGIPEELIEAAADRADEILDYYFRSLTEARPLNEAKAVLVGWGGVGKTSLVNRLLRDTFAEGEPRTEGIEVSSWEIEVGPGEQARLNVWDFGGQEIMHATHQFFLTTRSIYLLVLTGRSGSADTDAEYWLRVIESFASGSPIVVVLNQIDRDPFELDETGLRQRFPNVRSFVRTDCASARGIAELRAEVIRQTSELPDLRVSFPAAWFSIKDRLAGMDDNYLTFEAYRQLCAGLGELDPLAQERLAGYLHSLGIALNYRDDPRLRDTHVLNPHWVTEGIYTILNSRIVADHSGEVTTGRLAEILDPARYPMERHAFLLDLMRKFELCFAFPDEQDRYLVADLLPKQQPREAEEFADGLRFEYHYPVVPEGLLPRFIVRSHILTVLRWRSGCVLRWEDNHALVRADTADRRVRIWVGGPMDGRRRLLSVIRSDLDHIHRSYRFTVEAWVPVAARPGLAVQYDELQAAERAGMRLLPKYVAGHFEQVDVAELLNGVERRTARPRGRVRLFVSYSHRDEALKDQLVSHLKVLQMDGLIDVWHDRRIDPGHDWATEIDGALGDADIAVFLISADFFASDYCNGVEVARAFERQGDGLVIVPVIVRDCNWRRSRFAGLQALPTDARAVDTWPSRDTAWRIVSERIEDIARRL